MSDLRTLVPTIGGGPYLKEPSIKQVPVNFLQFHLQDQI